ncbi:NAD(P)-binding protein [Nonomuraea sp. NBC_01738]|uniref:NAD(P)-binding protein n=1 Tax=Nonomuraea sp. NBC_01738 TaxID=2976003 RepID=UPI002E0DA264|nr:NAD(P)-binding protein [Nonomuraea sp. NBC_01738]
MSEINPRKARELGMGRPISRRDFFDGVAMAAGTAALGSLAGCGGISQSEPGVIGTTDLQVPSDVKFPPGLHGLQGNTPQALSVPHALRDDRFWQYAGTPESTGENYDLVVVGGGISGVTAAFEWLRRDPKARILILENHDEIGGHARRNEFYPKARSGPLIGYGGSQSLEAPSVWTPEGKEVLKQLGVEVQKFDKYFDQNLYTDLKMYDSVMCDKETFPADRLIKYTPGIKAEQWVAQLPIAEQAKRDLLRLYGNPPDWFPGLSQPEKEAKLASLTYSQFLLDVCKAHPDVERFLRTQSSDEWAYSTRAFGAIDAWGSADGWDYPGFQGLKLNSDKPSKFNSPSMIKGWTAEDPYIYHFPEGNQALVRMMVGRMIPGFASATDMDGITTATFDYGRLDLPANRVRFRLSSPVVMAHNDGYPDTATTATVGYFDGHQIKTVRAGAVVMACWNMVIPYLVTALPAEQKQAMHQAVKMPLLYAMVQLRNWEAWRKVGINHTRWTGAYWCVSELDYPVSMPGYECPKDPSQPINVHMIAAPCQSEMGPSDGAIAGRHTLIKTDFSFMEYTIRDQLARLLGSGGFDPGKDIEAITVNRWGHGYAPEYCRPWNAFYPEGPFPAEAARQRFGRIAIANSDSIPAAYADAAITAAFRAVGELTT